MSDYQFASEYAVQTRLSGRIIEAAVAWQEAERQMATASALWHVARTTGDGDDSVLYDQFRLREQVRDGALAALAVATRDYMAQPGSPSDE